MNNNQQLGNVTPNNLNSFNPVPPQPVPNNNVQNTNVMNVIPPQPQNNVVNNQTNIIPPQPVETPAPENKFFTAPVPNTNVNNVTSVPNSNTEDVNVNPMLNLNTDDINPIPEEDNGVLSGMNVEGTYHNIDVAPDYVNEPKVRENVEQAKKNTVPITKELKTVIIIAAIMLLFIFVMPGIFDMLRNIKYR